MDLDTISTIDVIKCAFLKRYRAHMSNGSDREALELITLYQTIFGTDLTNDARREEMTGCAVCGTA